MSPPTLLEETPDSVQDDQDDQVEEEEKTTNVVDHFKPRSSIKVPMLNLDAIIAEKESSVDDTINLEAGDNDATKDFDAVFGFIT